jgi:hypothetical protein
MELLVLSNVPNSAVIAIEAVPKRDASLIRALAEPLRGRAKRAEALRSTRNRPNLSIDGYSSRSTFRNAGNNFIHRSATPMVPSPPSATAGIAPNKAAVMPLSNSPSW